MTVATNALLEGRGARTALIATEGFTDLVELGRQNRAELYRLCAARPAPLVPARAALRRPGADDPGRPAARGSTTTPRRRAGRRRWRRPRSSRWRSCCCTPTGTPSTSSRSARRSRERCPTSHVSLSHEVVGTFREYERAATTEVDAALSPLLARYLRRLVERAARRRAPGAGDHAVQRRPDRRRRGRRPRFLDGALGSRRRRRRRRVRGPRARACPMRSASTWAAPPATSAWSTTARSRSKRRRGRRTGRWRCRCSPCTPSGAGGGSIAWRDAGGALRVGPQSAGADPGPACYGRGGTEPTVTDANLVLGYLSTDAPLAGGVELDRGGRRGRSASSPASSGWSCASAPRGSSGSPTPRWCGRCGS